MGKRSETVNLSKNVRLLEGVPKVCVTGSLMVTPPIQVECGECRISADMEAVLKQRPAVGQLFPYLCTVRAGDRVTEFKQRCDGLGIPEVSLRSYRYALGVASTEMRIPGTVCTASIGTQFESRASFLSETRGSYRAVAG